ncbi:tetratricopeptide repeat protein [Aspergillus ibericus CBS 121593]|uniref:Uncharacterized protein n=1 Tax=Aspergillus ibericus CBS 121593 TaxID=1448316 RepID=A0A395GMM5_9EURO|nr:hypothetical protein BO80DRAFT_415988 [Aspergillus ibericus CBS 121593]RAK96755.1 hypothetical protein BO80DRAFT_415988 [Aspergillus ibericus CBS 121593]
MQFRYSTGTNEPTDFPWEAAIPVSPFWDSFSFKDAAAIIKTIPLEELEKYDLDARYGSATQTEKIAVTLDILREKLQHEESKYTPPAEFYTADHDAWSDIWLSIAYISMKLDRMDEAEEVYRMLVTKRLDPNDLVPANNLCAFLVKNTSKYEEVKTLSAPCMEWLDKKLGRASPQAIGVRKNIAEAEWKQGNRERAQEMIAEIFECIDELKGSRFAVYEDDEREYAQGWEEDLKKWQG